MTTLSNRLKSLIESAIGLKEEANELINAVQSGENGVSAVNSIAGAVTIVAGSNISVTPSGQNITIATPTQPSILRFNSSAGAGGAATEAMVVTGLLASDTILSVSQKTPGANSLPLLGWSTQANNSVTAIWSADPGAGSVILVAVKR